MKEARPQHKLTYVCSEGRTVCASMQMEVEYSLDLCTVKRAAGTGLLKQTNEERSSFILYTKFPYFIIC